MHYKDKTKSIETARNFIKWLEQNPDKEYAVSMLFNDGRCLIRKKTSCRVFPMYKDSQEKPAIFKGINEQDVLSQFKGYENFMPEVSLYKE